MYFVTLFSKCGEKMFALLALLVFLMTKAKIMSLEK